MSEKDTAESDKLMIMESGKRDRKGGGMSSTPIFHREIVGRHVIYKGPEGSKLRSLAEARRYFKQKGQALDESRFDFTPPVMSQKKGPQSAPSILTASSRVLRGRSSRTATPVSASKRVPRKAAANKKELKEDVKAIKDALTKPDDASGSSAKMDTSSDAPSAKKRRGRPPRKLADQPQMPTEPIASLAVESGSADTADASDHLIDESPMMASPDAESTGNFDQSDTRPSRRRRPNQRYTDLISEHEVKQRKEVKKSKGRRGSASKPSSSMPPFKSVLPQATAFQPKTSATLTVQASPFSRKKMSKKSSTRGKFSSRIGNTFITDERQLLKKPRPSGQRQEFELEASVSHTSEFISYREGSVSPTAPREFEAPPEFVEVQERPATPTTPQEDQLPPVLPAVHSSILSPATPPCNEVAADPITAAPEMVSPAPPMPLDAHVEPGPTEASNSSQMQKFESQAGSSQHGNSYVTQDFTMQVKRGRRPNDPFAKVGQDVIGAAEGSRVIPAAPPMRNYRSESTKIGGRPLSGQRFEIRSTSDAVLAAPEAASPDLQTDQHASLDQPPAIRGLARLQQKDIRKITIGRYGATSMVRTIQPAPDAPLELGECGSSMIRVTRKHPQIDPRIVQRPEQPDPSVYCHLPPEVSSDHCYGRQPGSTPKINDQFIGSKKQIIMGAKYRNGHPFGSPPMLEPAAEVFIGRRERRTYQGFDRFPHQFRTPSPPPYEPPRHRSGSAEVGFSGGLSGVGPMRGQQSSVLSDKLPANILEEDD